ncbi:MAG TPA: CHAT domain-containing protein [Thermoanaerobaculia bacterium]|nr:CHAT domain-containing protein [Thermoanaerobaculia bacterium]
MRGPIRKAWREALLRTAVQGSAHDLTPRFVAKPEAGALLAIGMSVLPRTRNAQGAASALLQNVGKDRAPMDLHAIGVAHFVHGNARSAVNHLRAAVTAEPHAEWWSDLAAAEVQYGDSSNDMERYVAALEATDHALALDEGIAQAHHNRAMAIERLGFPTVALSEWKKSVELERDPVWASRISLHVHELTRARPAREAWADAQQRIVSLSRPELERLIDSHPEEARIWGEGIFLPFWAKAYLDGKDGDTYLNASRVIGDRIAARAGERIVRDTVAAIDTNERGRRDVLARGLSRYFDGRFAFKEGRLEDAVRELEQSRREFISAGNPMADVVSLYLATSNIRRNRVDAARPALVALRGRSERASGHQSLAGLAEQYIALIDAMNGRWGDALETAHFARERFRRLGEQHNAAEAELIMGDVLTFLGQPHAAWTHYVRAARAFSATGNWDRLRLCAAEMSYLELRRHRWAPARAISQIELGLGGPPELLANTYLRAGAAAFGSGDTDAAWASIREARAVARSEKSSDTRERLFSDIVALEGRMLTASDPADAAARITESIDFQLRAGRAFALPELYLARGRARAKPEALADFRRGIEILESQRMRVRDYQLRAGFLDDPRDLFAAAVDASIDVGDVDGAFEYLERGRSRTLLEELDTDPQSLQPAATAVIRQSLEPGTILVAYALLPARVAIFVVDRNQVSVRMSDIPTATVREQVHRFMDAISYRRPIADTATALYDALVTPIHDLIGVDTVVIVPDPELEQVPFAALLDRRTSSYLIESHDLLIEPSAAVYVACAQRAKQYLEDPQSLALFANPEHPQEPEFPPLPAADDEAAVLARLYPDALVRRGAEATAARFRRDASHYGMVQFSGHARVNRAEPWKSALIFDEPMTAEEIASMRFPRTRMALLSACSTVAPDSNRMEGTSAIARAFLMAGVPAVAGTLWDVEDTAAAELTLQLHRRLARGLSTAAALRDVQRNLIRGPAARHPADWAGFVILGAD